jgi:hypothetical protein
MALNRARVYDALRAKLFAVAEWAETYDALPDENEVPEKSIAVLVSGQDPVYQDGRRPIWTCTATVILYVKPGTGLDLVDAIESALERQKDKAQPFKQFSPDGPNTNLGGLCKNLRMGTVNVDLIRAGSDKWFDVLWFDVTFTAV